MPTLPEVSVLFEVWKRTVPEGVVMRYGQIRRNLEVLRNEQLIPDKLEKVADVGFGSGAGSIALAELFRQATITAIDNASSQQNNPDYRRRVLPRWTSRLKDVSDDVKKVAPELGFHNVVMASRIPFSDLESPVDWKEDSLMAARTFVALASLAEPEKGVVLVGYNPHEDPGALWELTQRVNPGNLFKNLTRYQVEHGDDWLVARGVKKDILQEAKSKPEMLLTKLG
jgi:hypothetical protein